MTTSKKQGGKTPQEVLEQHNAVIISSPQKLASLIKAHENISWDDAKLKAKELRESSKAYDYVKAVRAKYPEFSDQENKPKPPKKSPAKPKKKVRRDRFSQNYRRLMVIAPDLDERLLRGEYVSGKSKARGVMDLNLDYVGQNERGYYISLSHYYEQNRDMIPDPDMVLRVDIAMEIVEALTYNDYRTYDKVYDDYMNPERVSPTQKKSQNAFLERWLKNLKNQGHKIVFDEDEIASEIVDEFDKKELENNENYSAINQPNEQAYGFIGDFAGDVFYQMSLLGEMSISDAQTIIVLESATYSKLIKDRFNELEKPTPVDAKNVAIEILELKAQKDAATQKKVEQESETDLIQETTGNLENSSDSETEEIKHTVKHWAKLAKVIRDVEGVDEEASKKKALELKSNDEAEEYVIRAFNRRGSSSLNGLFKLNYQRLIRLVPSLGKSYLTNENVNGELYREVDDLIAFRFESIGEIERNNHSFSFQEVGDNVQGVQIIGVNKKSKKTWLIIRSENFDGKSDFNQETANSASVQKANKQFGDWIERTISLGFVESSGKFIEQQLNKRKEEFPIVLEWTEAGGDKGLGFNSLEELQSKLKSYGFTENPLETYIKNKVWFKGYQSWIRIDLSMSKGDYNPNEEQLLEWLKKYDPSHDWQQYQAQKKSTVASEEEKQLTWEEKWRKAKKMKIPAFKVGKVKLTEAHKLIGLTQEDIDFINREKRGLTIAPSGDMNNKTKNFKADIERKALPPGMRVSNTGRLYGETRSNRSDMTDQGL